MSVSSKGTEKPANCIVSAVRIRPEEGDQLVEFMDEHSLSVTDDVSSSVKVYQYDQVFDALASQEEVYSRFGGIVDDLLRGCTVTTLAYGQTGSGKSYTMIGTDKQPGLTTRLISYLFDRLHAYSSCEVSVSLVEIYNEDVYDLLSKHRQKVDTTTGECAITETPVTNSDEAYFWFQFGTSHRSTASNNINEQSSRSHCILKLHLKAIDYDMTETEGQLYLVDLAGSERVYKSHVEGSRLLESQYINKSLSALGDTIQALDKRSSHVPYRNSKLTMFLRDGLQLQNRVYILFTVRGTVPYRDESVCTLEFASRVKKINLGNVRAQVKAKSLEIQNAALRSRILKMKEENESLQVQIAQLRTSTSKEREKLLLEQSKSQSRLDSAVQSYMNELNDLRRTIVEQKQQLSKYEEEVVRLRRTQDELQHSQQHCATLEKRVAEKHNLAESYQKTCDSLREQIHQFKSEREQMQRRILSLEGETKKLSSHLQQQSTGSHRASVDTPPTVRTSPPLTSIQAQRSTTSVRPGKRTPTVCYPSGPYAQRNRGAVVVTARPSVPRVARLMSSPTGIRPKMSEAYGTGRGQGGVGGAHGSAISSPRASLPAVATRPLFSAAKPPVAKPSAFQLLQRGPRSAPRSVVCPTVHLQRPAPRLAPRNAVSLEGGRVVRRTPPFSPFPSIPSTAISSPLPLHGDGHSPSRIPSFSGSSRVVDHPRNR